jgi:hypothetical protein
MELNLIPFGLRQADEAFVDVAEVARGRACGCICPSCKTPLIARQGEVKEWHFAHASRGVHQSTQQSCEFSLYVSVRMMARQMIGEQLEIELPELNGQVTEGLGEYGEPVRIEFSVAPRKHLTLTDVEVERSFAGVPVDVYGQIREIPFIIYFTHPGRPVPPELQTPSNHRCGILELTLNNAPALLQIARSHAQPYREALARFLAQDLASKRWIYHPRYQRCKTKAVQKAREKLAKQAAIREMREKTRGWREPLEEPSPEPLETIEEYHLPEKHRVIYTCLICKVEWEDWDPGASCCPECGEHLYRSVVRRLGG